MPTGDMLWAKHEWTGTPPPGVTVPFGPNGLRFSGMVIGPIVVPGVDIGPWQVVLKSHYFIDPSWMPASGESCISLPKLTFFSGGLGLKGGINDDPAKDTGSCQCQISLTQILRPGWVDVPTGGVSGVTEHVSDVLWRVGLISGGKLTWGQQVVTAPQKRDYGALFFNLDRTQTLGVTLVTTFSFSAWAFGVIAFAPLDVGPAPWGIHTIE
jgi:hypothetical protein